MNPTNKRRGTAPPPIHVTSADLITFSIVVSLIMIAGLLAVAFYWRARSIDTQNAQEDARRQREEAEKVLERLRDRMSLPSLVELNRLMLTEYHSIATNQAQKQRVLEAAEGGQGRPDRAVAQDVTSPCSSSATGWPGVAKSAPNAARLESVNSLVGLLNFLEDPLHLV